MIECPTKFEEMTLLQLEALGRWIDLIQKVKGKNTTPSEREKLFEIYGDFADLTVSQVRLLVRGSIDFINSCLSKCLKDAEVNYRKAFDDTKDSFKCPVNTEGEREAETIILKWWQFRKRAKAMQIGVYTLGEAKDEPAHIWFNVLDGAFKRMKVKSEDKPYYEWFEIRGILAALAWQKDKDRLMMINGESAVNWDLIERKKEVFKQVNARDAVRAFGFFLSTSNAI